MKVRHEFCSIAPVLDRLCPMHAVLDRHGQVVHAGPTLVKVLPDQVVVGQTVFDLFKIRRPLCDGSMLALLRLSGSKLHLSMRAPPHTDLKGVLVPLHGPQPENGCGHAVLNLSLGISVQEAVRDFSLTSGDFAVTDPTVEMLYLIEAKSAAMDASRKLNQRLQGAKVAAEEQAFTDTLTGLKNRRALDAILARLIANEQDFALLQIDLDYFKAVNDGLGHAAGDHVLQVVAAAMVDETRKVDTVARTGGDEFVIILTGVTDAAKVGDIAARLIARIKRPVTFQGQPCQISASIGAALTCDYDVPLVSRLIEDADHALYAAKHRGRGRYVVFNPRDGLD
ncbi:diguanylate cyclase [Roseovarius gahaiensis]|uniref:guanylate cyclase n=1 Tax=Roseovarius gahaiensis TaxID=2716691 RepID=A0A967BDY1_9RHOB|nr:GGDEF domain-containing protein [Roseovarius gahaiensis]NHQ75369.1 diguanylate cyclase [Roseovarius gahaiensis]